jgi:hypothetical protein
MTEAQVRIAGTIEQLYEDSASDGGNLAGSRYKDAIDRFDNESKSILVWAIRSYTRTEFLMLMVDLVEP